jgi:hypothetical protein
MQESLDAMRLAMRVLTAVSERQQPAPADVEALRALAPSVANLPPDEIACEVIQQSLKRREVFRAAAE